MACFLPFLVPQNLGQKILPSIRFGRGKKRIGRAFFNDLAFVHEDDDGAARSPYPPLPPTKGAVCNLLTISGMTFIGV